MASCTFKERNKRILTHQQTAIQLFPPGLLRRTRRTLLDFIHQVFLHKHVISRISLISLISLIRPALKAERVKVFSDQVSFPQRSVLLQRSATRQDLQQHLKHNQDAWWSAPMRGKTNTNVTSQV